MFGWSSRTTERLKSKQNGLDIRHCLKSELFGNGTTLESAKIQTFQAVTVFTTFLVYCTRLEDQAVERQAYRFVGFNLQWGDLKSIQVVNGV